MAEFRVGDRVRLAREVDLFPTIIAPSGATGVILVADSEGALVLMDEHFPQLDHWNNRLQVDVLTDLEHETPKRGVWSVAIYHEEQAWGGPEEGGWWFNAGVLQERPVRYFKTEAAAYAYARRLNHWLHRIINSKQRYEYSSVLSDGRYAAEVHNGHPPTHYPATRPHYE